MNPTRIRTRPAWEIEKELRRCRRYSVALKRDIPKLPIESSEYLVDITYVEEVFENWRADGNRLAQLRNTMAMLGAMSLKIPQNEIVEIEETLLEYHDNNFTRFPEFE